MENNEEFISLFDYLGRAAGPDLGKEIFKRAKSMNQPVQFREISNKKYKGKVVLYKREFLATQIIL